jgi:GNAT superfamily N-acetyltransferase
MNIRNFFTLTIRARDFNLVAHEPELMKKLRKLTLHSYSGLNRELDYLTKTALYRPVQAQVLLAYRQDKLVGWALLSKEESNMKFYYSDSQFRPSDGLLFEVFINPDYRRQGIASELIKVARRKAGATRLCVAPWDERSLGFYKKFSHYKSKWL